MYSKKSLVLSAATVVLLAGASVALASNLTDDRDSGLSARQTQLDEQFARSHSTTTVVPGTPARPISSYGYVRPHRPAAKHRRGLNR